MWHFSLQILGKTCQCVVCRQPYTQCGGGFSGTEVSGKLTWRWGPGMERGAGGGGPQGRINPQAYQRLKGRRCQEECLGAQMRAKAASASVREGSRGAGVWWTGWGPRLAHPQVWGPARLSGSP